MPLNQEERSYVSSMLKAIADAEKAQGEITRLLSESKRIYERTRAPHGTLSDVTLTVLHQKAGRILIEMAALQAYAENAMGWADD